MFQDNSSKNADNSFRCAILELVDGKQFFIEFKDAKEFVELLNNIRSGDISLGG